VSRSSSEHHLKTSSEAVFDCRIEHKLQKISKETLGYLKAFNAARW